MIKNLNSHFCCEDPVCKAGFKKHQEIINQIIDTINEQEKENKRVDDFLKELHKRIDFIMENVDTDIMSKNKCYKKSLKKLYEE